MDSYGGKHVSALYTALDEGFDNIVAKLLDHLVDRYAVDDHGWPFQALALVCGNTGIQEVSRCGTTIDTSIPSQGGTPPGGFLSPTDQSQLSFTCGGLLVSAGTDMILALVTDLCVDGYLGRMYPRIRTPKLHPGSRRSSHTIWFGKVFLRSRSDQWRSKQVPDHNRRIHGRQILTQK